MNSPIVGLSLAFAIVLPVCAATPAQPAAAMTPGTEIRDCADVACPTMVYIPAGSFMMGAADGETFKPIEPALPKATPRHRVTFAKPFAIGQTEVTKEQFAAFAAASDFQSAMRCSLTGRTVQILNGRNWKYPTVAQYTDDEPVLCTNMYDGEAYAAWLTQKTGHRYRLPSEAEWEYAARAGTQTFFFWGDDTREGCHYSNTMDLGRKRAQVGSTLPEVADPASVGIAQKLCDSGYAYKSGQAYTPVKALKPNPWGLYGVSGNGWEVVVDCWHQDYTGAPTDGSAWIDQPHCMRITRGDGGELREWAHIAHRYPVLADEHRSNTGTFRLVRELD